MYLIVFDGHCMLCNRFIQKILQNDKSAKFTFSTLQGLPSSIDQSALQTSIQDSISYLRNGVWFQKSTAVLLIHKDLNGAFHWTQFAWLCPGFLRDICYAYVAKHRYNWFGKRTSCYLPNAHERSRFIG
jgi:predicted DCC family thiol-disulfide oxidoreductase YuxK